ncbi:MAG: hypothetical protein BWY99_00638 [Synergistetes bacterium ADurb.BinA166]|nr:MAG: hypothetical protein BWY99_00638 [Synergistetes bacterium ADurb.BinA166]
MNSLLTMAIAATAASPWTAAARLSAMVATLARACLMNAGKPFLSIVAYRGRLLVTPPRLMRVIDCFLMNQEMSIPKLTHWLMAVAIAAPAMPRSSTKMNIGSSTRLSRPPVVSPTIARRAFPSARSMLFSRKEAAIIGAA